MTMRYDEMIHIFFWAMNMGQFRGNQVLQQQIISAQEAEMRLSNQAAALKVRWNRNFVSIGLKYL